MKIIVDLHERVSGIADMLAELGAEVELAPLPAGDYVVGAETLVERKRVLDLHAAVLKGRLWPQLGKLRAACDWLTVPGIGPERARALEETFNLRRERTDLTGERISER